MVDEMETCSKCGLRVKHCKMLANAGIDTHIVDIKFLKPKFINYTECPTSQTYYGE